jgi:type IV pilus assembly protein PilB
MTVKKRLGEMLLEAGVIDETQLQAALGHQRKWGGKLGQALQDLKLATEPQVVSALSRKFGYSTMNVAALPRTTQLESALKLVPRELAMRQTLLPIASDANSLTVAMADPSNIAVVDELSFRTGRRIKIALAGDREIAEAVRKLYFADEEPIPVAAISLEEISSESLLETTNDPFAAAPHPIREGSSTRSERTPASETQRSPGQRQVALHPSTPPPVLGRDAGPPSIASARAVPPAVTARPAVAPLAQVSTALADLLGEPILATELAPEEERDTVAVPPAERQLTPRQAALMDALERAARGEESGLVKPAQLAAVLARLLVRHGIVSEAEILEELAKK